MARVLTMLRRRFALIDMALLAKPVQGAIRAFRRRRALARPVRFAAFEFFGRHDRGAVHRLRDSPVRVAVRHRSRDVDILDEILVGSLAYEPPRELAHLLTDDMSVLDLGGNVGLFGAFILQHFPAASLVSVEPDPFNVPVIEKCIEVNQCRWQLVRACASASTEPVLFEARRYADSKIAESPSPNAIRVPAIDAFPLIAAAHFVKIDIEGGEWALLRDPRFRHVTPSVIVLEWHEAGGDVEDPYSVANDALTGAGYRTIGGRSEHPHGVIWAWREKASASSC